MHLLRLGTQWLISAAKVDLHLLSNRKPVFSHRLVLGQFATGVTWTVED